MKYTCLLFFLLIGSQVFSQTSRRFYPRVANIFMSQDFDGLPAEFKFLQDWCKSASSRMYYSDLQSNRDPRGAAGFNSLKLIVKKNYDFDLFDSGLSIHFNKKTQDKSTKVSVLNNNHWKVYSYTPHFYFHQYDPQNMGINFLYCQVVNNISDKEVIAHFINNFAGEAEPGTEETPKERFIRKLNEKLDVQINTNTAFDNICDSIRLVFPKSDCGFVAYQAFIETDSAELTHQNINDFFRPFEKTSLDRVVDEYLLPGGNFQFVNSDVSIALPGEYFSPAESGVGDSLLFDLNNILYDLRYDFKQSVYYMHIRLEARSASINHDFEFNSKRFDPVEGKQVQRKVNIKKEAFKAVEMALYPDKLLLTIHTNPAERGAISSFDLFEPIQFNQTED